MTEHLLRADPMRSAWDRSLKPPPHIEMGDPQASQWKTDRQTLVVDADSSCSLHRRRASPKINSVPVQI
jgi:hypothetical protein